MNETEIAKMIEEAFAGEKQCEVPGHAKRDQYSTQHRDGANVWYVICTCPECGSSETYICCEGFLDTVQYALENDIATYCPECQIVAGANDFFDRVVKVE